MIVLKRAQKLILHTILLLAAILPVTFLSVFAVPTSVLKLGSKGMEVIEVQQALADGGFLDEKYVTGFFGPNTEDAVKAYQKANGINQTGMVAELTVEAMFLQPEKLDTEKVYRSGDENSGVKQLQQALFEMGYLKAEHVTGYFGSITEAAVKSFQKDNDISQTGVAAKLTLEKINSLLNITKIDASRVYRSGDEDAGVKALQQRLYELGYLQSKHVTGYYGSITVAAVKSFQKNNRISQTGTVAELTIAALNSASAKTSSFGSSADASADSGIAESIAKPGTLRYGDSGAAVKTLQNNLKKLGYYSGSASGSYDTATKNAVIAFQKANSLSADGIVGSKTQSKITAALSAKNTGSSSVSSGYNSANMSLINQAMETLSAAQMNEVKLMAKIIKREVGGRSYKCQLAVGSVIMNRVQRTGASVREIIFSPNQFSTANSTLDAETYSTSNLYAAIEAYMGIKPVGNCLYFCSESVRYTCWAGKNRTYYGKIDTECFFL